MTTMTLRQAADRHPLLAAWGLVKLIAFASTVILPLLPVQVLGLWRAVRRPLAAR